MIYCIFVQTLTLRLLKFNKINQTVSVFDKLRNWGRKSLKYSYNLPYVVWSVFFPYVLNINTVIIKQIYFLA